MNVMQSHSSGASSTDWRADSLGRRISTEGNEENEDKVLTQEFNSSRPSFPSVHLKRADMAVAL